MSDTWAAWSVDRRDPKAIKPHPRNSRKHSDEQIAQIAASMREFGFTMPVLIDEGDRAIAGHARTRAAILNGYAEVPVLVARGWTEAQIRAYIIADNRLTELGEWDEDLLKIELAELRAEGFDIDLTGFDLEALNRLPSLGSLAAAFGVPPFSVLSARDGWWQARKRGWLALGIQSELGRGEEEGANVAAGGSPQPTVNPKTGKIARSDSRGKVVPGTDAKKRRAPAAAA